MAKGKHSVALFEVIQKGKSSSRASSLRTPKWWFKSKKVEPAPVIPANSVADESSAPAPRVARVDLKLDPDRKRINFDVTYNSAIVAAFTVVVVVGLAYVIGSHMTRGPASAMAGPSTSELLKGPAVPGVMKVGGSIPSTPPIENNPPIGREETITTPPAPTPAAPQPHGRVANLNYAVITSFPPSEKAMAFEISDYLNSSGVGASVEENVSGYSGWYVVMGLDGFQRPASDPNYKKYEARIKELSTKYPKKSFKRFDDPKPRVWRGNERTASAD